MKRATITKYMHTLDGKPAAFFDWHNSPAVCFMGGRHRIILANSLKQIREEQHRAQTEAAKLSSTFEWSDTAEVPQ